MENKENINKIEFVVNSSWILEGPELFFKASWVNSIVKYEVKRFNHRKKRVNYFFQLQSIFSQF